MEARNPICTSLSCDFRGWHVLHIKNLALVVNTLNCYLLSVMKIKHIRIGEIYIAFEY